MELPHQVTMGEYGYLEGDPGATADTPVVALIDWTHLYEDFLQSIGLDFDAFRTGLTGGWLFGYVEALRRAGVSTVFVCVSAQVRAPWRFLHEPTRTPVTVLPAPGAYRAARRVVVNPYAYGVDSAVRRVRPGTRWALTAIKEATPYLATPLRALRRELRRHRCGAALFQEYENPRFDLGVLVGRLTHVPVYAAFQGGNWQNGLLERFFRPLSLRACAGLVVGSAEESLRLKREYGVPPNKIAHIFNPLDLSQWEPGDSLQAKRALGIPPNAPTAVWHGRVMMKRKGLDVLAEAWARVCKEAAERLPWLILIGTGEDAGRLEEQLRQLGIERLVWLNEYVRDKELIRQHLLAGDVYLFPSRHEGFPVAPIEAMALGLPIVAARAPGVPDILEREGQHGGIVVPTGDVDAFARAILRLFRRPRYARSLGLLARQRAVEAFGLESIGRKLGDFLLSSSRSAPTRRRTGSAEHGMV